MEAPWQEWLERLYNLRRDKRGSHERPHKPVFLLVLDDLFAIVQDKFPISPGQSMPQLHFHVIPSKARYW